MLLPSLNNDVDALNWLRKVSIAWFLGLKMIEVTEKSKEGSKYHVPNLERALSVIELLAVHSAGLTLSEIVKILLLPKNSIFRITMTLLDNGYLSRDDDTKKFVLTRKLMAIGCKAVSEYSLVETAFGIMRQLRDVVRETVLIGTIARNELIVLEQAPGTHPFKFMLDIGSRIPLNAAAPAKAIMAYLPEKQLNDLLNVMDFTQFNQRTITTATGCRAELQEVRKLGYAIDRAEQLDGVHCIGAPVFDRYGYPVASIWTTGPSKRLPESIFAALGEQVREHADQISQRLGYLLPDKTD